MVQTIAVREAPFTENLVGALTCIELRVRLRY